MHDLLMAARGTEQGPDDSFRDAQPLSVTAPTLREKSLSVEDTAEGQNGLFASQDAHKLPSVALAAS